MTTQTSQYPLNPAIAKQPIKRKTMDPFKLLELRQRRYDEAAEAYYNKKQLEDAKGYAEFRAVISMSISHLKSEYRQELMNRGFTINQRGKIVRMDPVRTTTENTAPTKEQMIGLLERARQNEPDATQELDALMKADVAPRPISGYFLDMAQRKFNRLVSRCDPVIEMHLTTSMNKSLMDLKSSYDGPLEKRIVEHLQFMLLVAQCSLLRTIDVRCTKKERMELEEMAKESALSVGDLYEMLRSHRAIVASNLSSVPNQIPTP